MPLCADCNTLVTSDQVRQNQGRCIFCLQRICRICGCTESYPCIFSLDEETLTCGWATLGLCSNPACLERASQLFPIAPENRTDSEMALITEQLEVLLREPEAIVYAGLNPRGERVIGARLLEDDSTETIRSLHLCATEDDYTAITNSAVSFRQLVERATTVYIIDNSYDQLHQTVYAVSPADLPPDFPPKEEPRLLI